MLLTLSITNISPPNHYLLDPRICPDSKSHTNLIVESIMRNVQPFLPRLQEEQLAWVPMINTPDLVHPMDLIRVAMPDTMTEVEDILLFLLVIEVHLVHLRLAVDTMTIALDLLHLVTEMIRQIEGLPGNEAPTLDPHHHHLRMVHDMSYHLDQMFLHHPGDLLRLEEATETHISPATRKLHQDDAMMMLHQGGATTMLHQGGETTMHLLTMAVAVAREIVATWIVIGRHHPIESDRPSATDPLQIEPTAGPEVEVLVETEIVESD